MTIKNGLKSVGTFAKNVLGVVGPFVAVRILVGGPSENKRVVTYSDTVNVIMNSAMWSEDKVKAVSALKMNETTEHYEAVINVVKSSMWSGDKIELILKLCGQTEEA